jgi:hypothetical protein
LSRSNTSRHASIVTETPPNPIALEIIEIMKLMMEKQQQEFQTIINDMQLGMLKEIIALNKRIQKQETEITNLYKELNALKQTINNPTTTAADIILHTACTRGWDGKSPS